MHKVYFNSNFVTI